ncbi:MAG: SulP family inorganic anion transporter [Candidatus Sericytochromatia bacterium]|nr:SulP family inorganic anion transporter [Candidatus Sericytochromatia bacterium]
MLETENRALPQDGLAGLKENWRIDLSSGFQIALIALPLSLGIALASGMPPMAGLIAAIVGGLVVSLISGSFVTITGPAAGLIVIVLGGVQHLGNGDLVAGYRYTLAAIVIAGLIEAAFGLFKAGKLSAYFPVAAVHGMLAAIGVIILSKQIHTVFGVKPHGHETLEVMSEIPHTIMHANPDIAVIGLICLGVTILWALLPWKTLKKIPAPLIVVVLGIVLGHVMGLEKEHTSTLLGHPHLVGPKFLLNLPANLAQGIVFPDFGKIASPAFWGVVLSLALIGSLESLLSALAVDKLDVYGRKANLNRDIFAVGIGTAISGMLGGLPMISEIVRSSVNVSNGARTRWANFFHGLFILLSILLLPGLIQQIPLTALAALLVYTGYRLASPKEFVHTYHLGKEQLLIFVATLFSVLATDLLIGVACGVVVNIIVVTLQGSPFKDLFKLKCRIEESAPGHWVFKIQGASVFCNLITLKHKLESLPPEQTVRIEFHESPLVDHTVMVYLQQFAKDYRRLGGQCEILGLEEHTSVSDHPLATRKKQKVVVTS